jgi:anti-anti-sigma factor
MSELSERLGITIDRSPNGRVVVRLVGALDVAGAARRIDETTRLDPGAGDRVVLQLHDGMYLDSTGVGALCHAAAFVKARGGNFEICTPRQRSRAGLEVAGLTRYCNPDVGDERAPEPGRHRHRAQQPAVPR